MADVTRFGQYELRNLVGRGGMGEVYEAFDREQHRLVALKLLPPALAADQGFVERFRRESFAAAQLNDPHVIPIHRSGEIDGRLYIDMRLVKGLDLAAVLERDGPLPAARAVSFISQAAEALDAAHTENLIHRDVKPSNLLVTAQDFVYLVDFGIAHVFGLGTTGQALTATGATIGTLDYMAPERFIGRTEVDARTDVYSLSCVLYECLTGARPFPVDGLPALLHAHLNTPPPRASDRRMDLPKALDDVIARGMAKEPADRFGTTGELAREAMAAITGLAPENSGTTSGPRRTTVPWAASPFGGTAGIDPASPSYRSPADLAPTPAPPTYIPQRGGTFASGGNPVPGFTGPAAPPTQLRPSTTPPPNGAVAGGKRRRNRMFALIAATVAVVAVAGGVLVARDIFVVGTDPVAVAVTSSQALSNSSLISPSPTPSPSPNPSPSPSPSPTPAPSTPPPPAPTPTTVTVTSVLPPSNNGTLPATGDLGLSEVIENIGCSGKYLTFLGSSVDPSLYRAEIGSLLANNPGSSYLMTESSCASLTPRVDGNSVYAVYLGPFSTATQACGARRAPENYVKVLEGSDPDESAIEC